MRPTVLAFDTSGPFCGAALLLDATLHVVVEDMARGQGERLMPLIEELLAQHDTAWSDLDGIGVGVGPGNFTGIRISVSAARGLALGLGVPAVGVSAFEAAAYGVSNVIACIPAPRGHAYVQARVALADQDPKLVDLPGLKGFPDVPAKAEARLVGPAARDVAQALHGPNFNGTDIVEQPVASIDAIAWITAKSFRHTTQRPAPLYVRPADAAPSREPPVVILP